MGVFVRLQLVGRFLGFLLHFFRVHLLHFQSPRRDLLFPKHVYRYFAAEFVRCVINHKRIKRIFRISLVTAPYAHGCCYRIVHIVKVLVAIVIICFIVCVIKYEKYSYSAHCLQVFLGREGADLMPVGVC